MRLPAILAVCLWAAETAAAQPALWLDVPFIRQPAEGCGAASVAMVMQYWERRLARPATEASDVSHIQTALFSASAHGAYASALEGYLAGHGFQVFVSRGDLGFLAHHIERGRPLLVALKPSSGPQLHYMVVSGVDLEQHIVSVNDPAQRKLLKVDSRKFEAEWGATGYWTLLAVPRPDSP
ncbi:MAG TPA: C39 family peptidase [Terriglobales bacterium]|nr:C39 family peptidase [Terriglobales bacterium]